MNTNSAQLVVIEKVDYYILASINERGNHRTTLARRADIIEATLETLDSLDADSSPVRVEAPKWIEAEIANRRLGSDHPAAAAELPQPLRSDLRSSEHAMQLPATP